jgi:uncharacterized protein YjlB
MYIEKKLIPNSFYSIIKVKNYITLNKKLIKLIKQVPNKNISIKEESIFNTDWNLPKDTNRTYLKVFYKHIEKHLKEFAKTMFAKRLHVTNCWFQQYKKNNFHDWHSHEDANFTNIYYVQLPEKHMQTELYVPFSKKIITLDVKEGDLVTFPAYIFHRSKQNISNKIKTVISFNSSIMEYGG